MKSSEVIAISKEPTIINALQIPLSDFGSNLEAIIIRIAGIKTRITPNTTNTAVIFSNILTSFLHNAALRGAACGVPAGLPAF
jgi:hypothetical protein